MASLNLLPEPAFAELKSLLNERLERMAASLRPEQFSSLLDPVMQQVLEEGFTQARADEGTLWLIDAEGENLVPAFNNGPNAERFVGEFRQPLNAGLICMVFSTEQPFIENEVDKNANQSRLLDTRLQVKTHALIAVPFYFLQRCRGVASCVQLKPANRGNPAGFGPKDLETVQLTANVLGRLLEHRLLGKAVDWEGSS
ncbi:MAG: hypothetical protein C5B50_21100 [Verrucomicrobia bacterium]|nr:MAG: hypothetical protein C5B50_21100 [Verrucomicrobiota bacterium]